MKGSRMAFCTYCGRDVAPEARSCPGCGKPSPTGVVTTDEYAEWGTRVGAYLIDGLVACVPLVLAFALFAFSSSGSAVVVGVPILIAGFAWALLYKPVFEGRSGQTVGKRMLGIKVVREDGRPMSYGPAFARWVVAWVINWVPFGGVIDDLWPLWDDRNQTLHDKAAKTLVVRVPTGTV